MTLIFRHLLTLDSRRKVLFKNHSIVRPSNYYTILIEIDNNTLAAFPGFSQVPGIVF